jgi:PilZ domain
LQSQHDEQTPGLLRSIRKVRLESVVEPEISNGRAPGLALPFPSSPPCRPSIESSTCRMPPETPKTASLAAVEMKERRRQPRYPVSAMAEAIDLRSDTHIHGRISDISRGGCYVEVLSPFAVASEVRVQTTQDGRSFCAIAKVLHSMGGMGMGLAFTEIESSQLPVLDRWLAELGGDAAPEPAAAESEEQATPAASSHDEQRYVLNELIITLIRNRVLTDAEGKALLHKLL